MAEVAPMGTSPIPIPINDNLTLNNDNLANVTATTVATVVAEMVTEVEARVREATTAMAAEVADNLSSSALPHVKNVTSFAESTFVQVSSCRPFKKLLNI